MKSIKRILFGLIVGVFVMSSMSMVSFAQTPSYAFAKADSEIDFYKVSPGDKIEVPFSLIDFDAERDIILLIENGDVVSTDEFINLPFSWLELPDKLIHLKKKSEADYVVKIFVPKDAELGRYKTVFTAKLADYEGRERGGAVSFSTAIGVAINVEVVESQEGPVVKGLHSFPVYIWGVVIGLLIVFVVLFLRKKISKSKKRN